MKLITYTLVGTIIGAIAGFCGPIVLYYCLKLMNPALDGSEGIFFSFLMILTLPVGVLVGGVVGAVAGGALRD